MRIEPRELAELSLPPPQRFAVPANTLVVADTCGFHGRCPSSKSARRVEIWAYSRRNPFLPWTGRSEEHTSELQSLMRISYAVFCLKKKKTQIIKITRQK